MFANYFLERTGLLEQALAKKLKKRKVPSPEKQKDLRLYEDFYNFLREHLPSDFSLATGRVRSKKQILNRNCDALIYKKWCDRYLDISGGYVLAESLYAFISLESNLVLSALISHVSLSRALKSIYAVQKNQENTGVIPLYSILFAYSSTLSLLYLKQGLMKSLEKKEIPGNQQVDMVCVLGKGLIVKDWESGGYRGIETGRDTLMWFYIIFMEYLDREGSMQLNLREYIKNNRNYSEC